MGFHWEWCDIHKVEPGLSDRLFEFTGFPARKVVSNLTFDEMDRIYSHHMSKAKAAAGACAFRGWTCVFGSALLAGKEVGDVAKHLGAEICVAAAESTSWTLYMEYARPDGTVRKRSYGLEGTDVDFKPKVVVRKDAAGNVIGWDLSSTAKESGAAGREATEGAPLAGERTDLEIKDDDKLLAVLRSIEVPLPELMDHLWGAFDPRSRTVVPGPGATEKMFIAYILSEPEPDQPGPPPAPPKTGGLFGRLFRK